MTQPPSMLYQSVLLSTEAEQSTFTFALVYTYSISTIATVCACIITSLKENMAPRFSAAIIALLSVQVIAGPITLQKRNSGRADTVADLPAACLPRNGFLDQQASITYYDMSAGTRN